MKSRELRTLVLIYCATSATARAQTSPLSQPIDSGALVRLAPLQGPRVIGRLVARLTPSSGSITFCRYPGNPCTLIDSSGLRSMPLANINAIEITRSTRADRGALIGGGIGFALGLFEAALIRGLCETQCPDPGMVVLGSTAGGAIWGAIFGSTAKVWQPAP